MAMKSRQRRMILKLDIRKAYDRVDRSFLLAVLAKFGFSKSWIKWISNMVTQFFASVLVNGSPQGFFPSSRGIRQGDSISPFLFILMVEVLGCSIARKRSQGLWKEASVMKKVLDRFSWATGQEINWQKLEIFFFHTEAGSQRSLARLFGIRVGQLPGKFLGTSLFAGAGKAEIWKWLLDGYIAKLEGWKSKWLTLAGRLLMLKTVISIMSIFSMACFKLPGTIIKNIQQKMRISFVER
ncbi:uncharacterized protein LOC131857883 [Cryptomeria japonica]|uniref:uncharacterized protein LOC131857883 n=1 Tax=Cryptomeria japonica TaxID=3369 RepID=UPI0027D9E1E3|nr:uncharacterized protein LOC131857883 [Cryptomeria japonica]